MYKYIKRVLDFAIAIVLLIILSPILVFIGILIKCYDKGPVFYLSKRVGQENKPFVMYKFRTMLVNANQVGSWFTQNNDPRITKLGSFLRKSSLDELPQLINVVKGDMSLVGPRPYVSQSLSLYQSDFLQKRHAVKPGMTGLAQVLGRSNLSREDTMRLDLKYLQEYSFWMDLQILYRTILVVACAKAAW